MKTKKKKSGGTSASGLATYFPKSTDPGYVSAEATFIADSSLGPAFDRKLERSRKVLREFLSDPSISPEYKDSPPHYYLMRILECMERTSDHHTRYKDEVGHYVIQAMKEFGMDAIRLTANDLHQIAGKPKDVRRFDKYLHPRARAQKQARRVELANLNSLSGYVCLIIRYWQERIKFGKPEERGVASKWLREVGKHLIPETRGLRKNKVAGTEWDVKQFYYRELFRLHHIDNALRSRDGPRNSSLRVKQASENFTLSVEIIREFWGLDEDDQPDRQPFSLKDMARELTARKFNAKHQTISNLLSS